MVIVAFDFSLSCPAMCIRYAASWNNSQLYYLTDTKKYAGTHLLGQINGSLHLDYTTSEQRHNAISDHFIAILDLLHVPPQTPVFIEDYSFGSKGRVFHIAENTGLMKHKLWVRGHSITVVPPTVLKKFATTKGNATKEAMYAAFIKETGVRLAEAMNASPTKIGSPVSDIVDAWWLAQYGYTLTVA